MTAKGLMQRLTDASRREFFLVEGVAFLLLATGVVLSMTASFVALRGMAEQSGQPGGLSWIWPLIIDGAIILATAALIVLTRHSRKGAVEVPWTAYAFFWLLLSAGEAISITGNAVHAVNSPTRILGAVFAAVVAALAPLGSLAYVHGFAVLVRIRTTAITNPIVPADIPVPVPTVAAPTPEMATVPDNAMPGDRGRATEQLVMVADQEADSASPVVDTDADSRRVLARTLAQQGRTHGQIATELGVSKRTVRRYLAAQRDLGPESTDSHLAMTDAAESAAGLTESGDPVPPWLSGLETNHNQSLQGVLT